MNAPFMRDAGGMRHLHFSLGEVQSAMEIARPDVLAVDYTRTMMAFLHLAPRPAHVVLLGMGGGSQAKFCLRHLPGVRVTAVEIDPAVIALREAFALPPDGPRFSVVHADAAAWIASPPEAMDVLLVDGFDAAGQVQPLCTQAFYVACRAALAPGGVLAANLHAAHPSHAQYARQLAQAFGGNAVQVLASEGENCVVLAARDEPLAPESLRGDAWKQALDAQAQAQLRAEMDHVGWNARAIG